MPRYLAKNCLNELLQSFQSSIVGLLISEEIPRLELAAHDAAQQSLVSNFVSSHPWLQDKIDFSGLDLAEMKICEEVRHRLPMTNSSSITGSWCIPSFFQREAEWCLPKSQFDAPSPCCCLAELCNCCISVAQPLANNWTGVKNTADVSDYNEISQFILEEVLMDSYGSRGRLPLGSELIRRLKPAVVPDPLFGQIAVSETLIFRDEIAPLDPLLRKWDHTLYQCNEFRIEDEQLCYALGIETQNLVLEEPIALHGRAFDGARQLLLALEPRSLLDVFHEEFNSAEEAELDKLEEDDDGQELIICGVPAAAAGGLQLETGNLNHRLVGPVELLSKLPPSENGQRPSFIMINETLRDAVKRESFLWLESPLLRSHTPHQCNCCALCPDCLAVEEDVGDEEETADQQLTEPSACCLLSKLSEKELLAKLWQNEKYFDEIQLLAVREFQLESTTCDVVSVKDGLTMTSVSSAVDDLCLTSEEITSSQELDLAWDPLKTSYGLMAATEKLCMEPAMQRSSSCPGNRLHCSSAVGEAADENGADELSSGSASHHPSPLLLLRQRIQTVETYKKGNIQTDQCVSYDHQHHHHLTDPIVRHRPTAAAAAAAAAAASVSNGSSDSHRSSRDVALQIFDPLDQFLMLRNAPPPPPPPPPPRPPSSKGRPAGTAAPVDGHTKHGGGGGGSGSGSSLVAVVQPCVNSAAAAIESSSNPLPLWRIVSDASSGCGVFPAPGNCCCYSEEEEEEAETKKSNTNLPASTIINISLTAPPFENLLRLIEDAARPFLALLRRHRILASHQTSFKSLQSDVMGFIVKQQQNDFSAVTDDDVELKMDLLRAAICVHCLVTANDHLIDYCLSSAAHMLSVMKARNQQIILVNSVLDNVLQKVLLEQVRHGKDEILHPKALEMCHLMQEFYSTSSRTDFKSKILVILPSSDVSHDVTLCLGQYLLETLTSVEGIRPVLLSSSLLPADLDKRSDACNCYLVASNHLTKDDWGPWTDFALVIEYSFSLASAFKEKCLLLKLPFVGLRSNTEILQLANDDDGNDDEIISRSCLQQISIVMSRDLTFKHKELIRLLETRYNVVITDRDYASLVVSGYFEDITVGGSTVIVIEDLMVLRRKQEMERLVMKVNGLRQKSVSCWILVFSANNGGGGGQRPHPSTAADSSDIYSTNIIVNISKLQASFGVLAKPDFQIKVVFCHSYNSMAMRIRQIASDALSRTDSSSSSSSSSGQMKVASSCPTIEPAEDERFLLSFPSLNSISAQMLLRTGGSLKTLLSMFKADLLETLSSSSLPNKIIQALFEFRESVGEIFLILRHAQCSAGQDLKLLSISQSNENNNSSENICPLTPHNATFASCPIMAADWTEGMNKEEEEEDLSKDVPLKTHCLSSPKLNDFQEAEMFGKNFATFLSRLKSDLSDEVRFGTEEVEKERMRRRRRLAVQFDCNDDDDDDDVHPIDLNSLHSQSVEVDGQLNYFSFTENSGKSLSARIPLMLRNESKWINDDDGFALNAAAVVSAAAAASAGREEADNDIFKDKEEEEEEGCSSVPKTCCYSAISSNGSTSIGRHLKTITDKSSINSNSTDKFPLGTCSTLTGEGDIIYDCRNVLRAEEDRFFSNAQEIEKYRRAQDMQGTGLNDDGASVKACYRTQVDFGNMHPDVEIVGTFGTGCSDADVDYVDRRRFRQPVQSLTLDGNNFPEQKLKRNFWSHTTRGRHPFGCWWLSQESSSPAHACAASLRKRKLTFERDDATKSGQTKLKFI